jgi:hypothetical protein
MSKVKITWKAFGDHPEANPPRFVSSVEFSPVAVIEKASPLDICNQVFRDTNLYEGPLWKVIEPLLSPSRTHTALSVGDEVEVDGAAFRCESAGWSKIN